MHDLPPIHLAARPTQHEGGNARGLGGLKWDWTVEAALVNAHTPVLRSLLLIDTDSPQTDGPPTGTEFVPANHPRGLAVLCTPPDPRPWRMVDRSPIHAVYEPDRSPPGDEWIRYELLTNGLTVELARTVDATTGRESDRPTTFGVVIAIPRTLYAAEESLEIRVGGGAVEHASTGSSDPVSAEAAEVHWGTSDRALRIASTHKGVAWTVYRPPVAGHPGVAAAHIELHARWDLATAGNGSDDGTIRCGCTLTPRRGV